MGGVSISVKNNLARHVVKTSESNKNDEYIITRFDQFQPPLNLMSIYGEQECRTSKDEIENNWQNLLREINKIENRNENLIIIGDLNKAVGNDYLGVKDSNEKISQGGKHIRALVKDRNFVIVNNTNKCKGCLLYTSPSPRDS